jgi:hypothetical protein
MIIQNGRKRKGNVKRKWKNEYMSRHIERKTDE